MPQPPPIALTSTAVLLLLLGAACGATERDGTLAPAEPTPAPTDQLIRQPSSAPTIDPAHRSKVDALLLSAYQAAASHPAQAAALKSMAELIELTTQNGIATVGALISGTPSPTELAAAGFVEQTRIGNIVAGHFPLLELPTLAALDSIDRIEASAISTLQAGN